MFFVSDVERACSWYSQLLGLEPVYLLPDFPVLRVGEVEICFHRADSKVASGAAGAVAYWRVEDFGAALVRSEKFGGVLHRGPLEIENGCSICQIRDPFGNLFGLMGPSRPEA